MAFSIFSAYLSNSYILCIASLKSPFSDNVKYYKQSLAKGFKMALKSIKTVFLISILYG